MTTTALNESRRYHLIRRALKKFSLELDGLTVLTEAATGYYMLTPLIAALAGADKVYCIAQDSRYGLAGDAAKATMNLAKAWGMAERIEVLAGRDDPAVGLADIVTNLGFVRPLDAHFLKRLKSTTVIPLMWETWEFRAEDLDLEECRRRGIPVLGTNEHHPDLRTFDYVGLIAVKMLFQLDIEIFQSNLVIIGSGEFAEIAKQKLEALGGCVAVVKPVNRESFTSDASIQAIKRAEAILVIEHHSRRKIIGADGMVAPPDIRALNPSVLFVHMCGEVDRDALVKEGFCCFPERFSPAGYMSLATDYLGPRPLIDLHTAGLKVGELLARARLAGESATDAERLVLHESDLAQGF